MKRTDPKSIAQIIDETIEQSGLTNAMAEQRACYIWPEIVGPGVNRYTFRRYVDHGIMHVYITSAALKNELSFHRTQIMQQINSAIGTDAITSIVFH